MCVCVYYIKYRLTECVITGSHRSACHCERCREICLHPLLPANADHHQKTQLQCMISRHVSQLNCTLNLMYVCTVEPGYDKLVYDLWYICSWHSCDVCISCVYSLYIAQWSWPWWRGYWEIPAGKGGETAVNSVVLSTKNSSCSVGLTTWSTGLSIVGIIVHTVCCDKLCMYVCTNELSNWVLIILCNTWNIQYVLQYPKHYLRVSTCMCNACLHV